MLDIIVIHICECIVHENCVILHLCTSYHNKENYVEFFFVIIFCFLLFS